LASGVVITEENGKTEVYGSENYEIDKASEIGLNKKGMEVAGSVPFVKASPDGDLVGTASAHPVASVSKAEGEDSKAVSDVELEVMNGSESSEEGTEPYGTELADEVTCSVYGSNDHEYLYENVNCCELDVLDVNSDRPVKVKLAELFVEENKDKQIGNMVECLSHDHQVFDKYPERNPSLLEPCLATDGFVGKLSGPANQIPQGAGSISMDKSHPIDKGVKPSWADIVEGRGGTYADKVFDVGPKRGARSAATGPESKTEIPRLNLRSESKLEYFAPNIPGVIEIEII
ncbi:hypothetical protein U1Q18_014584, partial [Sarracenia purpurea var. burkii]